MTEDTLGTLPKRSSAVVKCEKHGLHYDSSKMSGCVICRREAAGGTAVTTATATAAEAQSGALGPALLVTLVLLALTTGALFFAHTMVARSFKTWLPEGGDETTFESGMDDVGMPADAAEPVDVYSEPEGDGD